MTSMEAGISRFFYAPGRRDHLPIELEISHRQAPQAQRQMPQSQLDRHMIFNTLSHLRALITTDPLQATPMRDSLIEYLRDTLHAPRETTLSES